MGCSFGVEQVLACLAFAINIIAAAAYFNMFESHTDVETGCNPGNYGRFCNASFYMAFSVFALGLVCLIFAIAELGLMIKPDWFSFVDSPFLRGIVYILSGIAVLGASGDLGIAAGALQMIIGVVLIVYFVVIKGKGGCKC
ncbi:hypothetical protein TRFO_03611 [Tritrichomonas foetus]|uniref:Uncharacterized protein n=1 Tax=Tritrichomonas foetus TaxID=1144522 RepID=A0A1J4KMP8_9EUKA|nr:hypothetical protein TRFO_03611 [Tritrichomonas foetus]|eukprot:OHT12591.1 hypothetical protein TRFO_03611 [Tritrichomonas foetus]